MPRAYVTVTTLKSTGALNIDGTAYDTRLRGVIEAVSEQIDRYCNRTFQPYSGTYDLDGDGGTLLLLPRDLVSIGTLLEDNNEDGTFEVGWATTDYLYLPRTAAPTSDYGRPYTRLQVNPHSNGTQDEFIKGPQMYRVSGTWGFLSLLATAAPTVSGSLGSTATAVPLSTVGVEPGMTVLVDTEAMFVQSTATNTLTVTRGVNGNAAATHASGTVVQYYDYPRAVKEACLVQSSRLWKRRESGYATEVGIPETGIVTVYRGLDTDVQELLAPLRRLH